MYLGYRGAGYRGNVEFSKYFIGGLAIGFLYDLQDCFTGKWRHLVLQLGEFFCDVRGDEIAACRNDLAKLDEDWPQFLQCQPEQHCAQQGFEHRPARMAENELIQTEAETDRDNVGKAKKLHGFN